MSKNFIYLCTVDTIAENLLLNGLEEKLESIIEELNEDGMVFRTTDGTYIMGQAIAAFLKLKYGINTIMKELE